MNVTSLTKKEKKKTVMNHILGGSTESFALFLSYRLLHVTKFK